MLCSSFFWQMIGKQLAMMIYKNYISKSLVINWYKIGKGLVTDQQPNKKMGLANHLAINDW